MKQTGIAVLFIVITLSIVSNALSQWVHSYGASGYVSAIVERDSTIYAGTEFGTIWLSTDKGNSWDGANGRLSAQEVYALILSNGNIFAGTDQGSYLLNSDGISWTCIDTGIMRVGTSSFAKIGTNLFSAKMNGVFLSTNNGSSWKLANTGLKNYPINTLGVKDTFLFAGSNYGKVFISTNSGTNWVSVSLALTDNTKVEAIASHAENIFAGTYGHGIYLSTNNGQNWRAVNNGLSDLNVQALIVVGSNVFAGTRYGGAFLSTNNGESWDTINTGLTNLGINDFFASNTDIFLGSFGGGFHRRPLSDFGISAVKNPTQSNLSISLSPNPTTGIITVLNAPINTHVTILNVLGESVKECTNAIEGDFTFDLSKQSPGTYFARFSSANEVIIRKIIKE
jgi:photosystem II stability/assembly factor-like uncharacterized protein